MSILPSPLHPVIVHMPIALAILVPFFALGALGAIRRGAKPRIAWGMTVGMLTLLLVSGWVALQTGEADEDNVEPFVSETAIETHEEAAEQFVVAVGTVLLLASAGLIPGRTGAIARVAATVGTVALVGAAYSVGGSGGELVYGGRAADAYSRTAPHATGARSETTAGAGSVNRGRVRKDDDR